MPRRRAAVQRAASASWSERNGANAESLTTPSSGSRSRSQTSLLAAAFCIRIVHAAYASARCSARSSRVTAARARSPGSAPSAVVSARASTTNLPSAVRIVVRLPVRTSKTTAGADVARTTPRPSGSQLGAGETVTSRASTGANVERKRATSADDVRADESRPTISAERSSSPRIPRATAMLDPASARAVRYATELPPKRAVTTRRSIASASEGETRARSRSTARATSAVRASSRSRGDLRERRDTRRGQLRGPVEAAHAGCEAELPDLRVRVELVSEDGRRVAQVRVARPQPHAGGVRLVGIVRPLVALCPAPGPDVCEVELLRDLLHGERVPLGDAEPARPRLQPFASARARAGLEADHDPDPRRRDPDREELRDRLAVPDTKSTRAVDRAVAPDEIRVGVVLEHEVGDRADRSPPRRSVAARERLARDEERRPSTSLLQARDEAQDVRPVALRGRRERGRERGSPQLVQRDQRRLTARDLDGVVEERVGALVHQRRVGGVRRRPDPLAQVHVPVHGPGARCPGLGCDARPARRDDDAGPCESLAPERHRAVGEVDPGRLSLRKTARERSRARRRPGKKRGDESADGEESPAHGHQR